MQQRMRKNQINDIIKSRKWLAQVTALVVFLSLLWAQPVRAADMKPAQLFFRNAPVAGEAKAIIKDGVKFVNLPFLNRYLQIISQWDPDTGKIELKFGKLNLTLTENQVNYSRNEDS